MDIKPRSRYPVATAGRILESGRTKVMSLVRSGRLKAVAFDKRIHITTQSIGSATRFAARLRARCDARSASPQSTTGAAEEKCALAGGQKAQETAVHKDDRSQIPFAVPLAPQARDRLLREVSHD